jgi:hypothetical protein
MTDYTIMIFSSTKNCYAEMWPNKFPFRCNRPCEWIGPVVFNLRYQHLTAAIYFFGGLYMHNYWWTNVFVGPSSCHTNTTDLRWAKHSPNDEKPNQRSNECFCCLLINYWMGFWSNYVNTDCLVCLPGSQLLHCAISDGAGSFEDHPQSKSSILTKTTNVERLSVHVDAHNLKAQWPTSIRNSDSTPVSIFPSDMMSF